MSDSTYINNLKKAARISAWTCVYLIAIVSTVLWVRSYWVQDRYYSNFTEVLPSNGQQTIKQCISNRGMLVYTWQRRLIESRSFAQSNIGDNRQAIYLTEAVPNDKFWSSEMTILNRLGFGIRKEPPNAFAISLPHAMFALPSILLAALHARKHLSVPKGVNACRRCGYDLRATPGRCPECGDDSHGAIKSG